MMGLVSRFQEPLRGFPGGLYLIDRWEHVSVSFGLYTRIMSLRPTHTKLEIKVCEPLSEGAPCPSVCPSARWRHGMCLTDHHTAVLIGGEASATSQVHSKDSLWKLDTGQYGFIASV